MWDKQQRARKKSQRASEREAAAQEGTNGGLPSPHANPGVALNCCCMHGWGAVRQPQCVGGEAGWLGISPGMVGDDEMMGGGRWWVEGTW